MCNLHEGLRASVNNSKYDSFAFCRLAIRTIFRDRWVSVAPNFNAGHLVLFARNSTGDGVKFMFGSYSGSKDVVRSKL